MSIQERIKKPDHPFWKKVGNLARNLAQPIGAIVILAFVPPPFKEPATAAWIVVCNAIKGATKLSIQ